MRWRIKSECVQRGKHAKYDADLYARIPNLDIFGDCGQKIRRTANIYVYKNMFFFFRKIIRVFSGVASKKESN